MEKSFIPSTHQCNYYLFILLFRAKDEVSEDVAGYLQEVPEEMIFDTRNIQLLDSVGQGNLNANSFLAYCL